MSSHAELQGTRAYLSPDLPTQNSEEPNLDPMPERWMKAKAAVDAARRLDPALPEAHLALGC